MKLSDLRPNPENPRKITEEQLINLKRSLDEFGDLSGIIFNRRSNQIVGGHQRITVLPESLDITIEQKYAVATKAGTLCEGFVMWEGERFKYREVDWDANKEKLANLAANKHGGSWDYDGLTMWLTELKGLDLDLSLAGFGEKEVMDLLNLDIEKDLADIGKEMNAEFILSVSCQNEFELEKLFEELKGRGMECKIIM